MPPSTTFPAGTSHILQTEQLNLVPFTPGMLSELHQLFIAPLARRYLLYDEVKEVDWVDEVIQKSQKLFEQSGYGLWALQEKGKQQLIGFGGDWYIDQLSYPLQLIYGLLPDYWSKGLATEAARKVIAYGLEQVSFTEIMAAADIPNTASFEVMKRLGMSFWKREELIDFYILKH